ncbi:hypothetical protein ABZT48_06045 [Streptomyces avermitilis]|uniref:hypothetical protein n=1 Tax=Streptomyces avermitilis TaxID=33903 RepID=UPI0033A0A4AC
MAAVDRQGRHRLGQEQGFTVRWRQRVRRPRKRWNRTRTPSHQARQAHLDTKHTGTPPGITGP